MSWFIVISKLATSVYCQFRIKRHPSLIQIDSLANELANRFALSLRVCFFLFSLSKWTLHIWIDSLNFIIKKLLYIQFRFLSRNYKRLTANCWQRNTLNFKQIVVVVSFLFQFLMLLCMNSFTRHLRSSTKYDYNRQPCNRINKMRDDSFKKEGEMNWRNKSAILMACRCVISSKLD